MFALIITGALKNFERPPVYAAAPSNIVLELTSVESGSITVVKARDCDDDDGVSDAMLNYQKSDCKAVMAASEIATAATPDSHSLVRTVSGISSSRPVDVPPPIA